MFSLLPLEWSLCEVGVTLMVRLVGELVCQFRQYPVSAVGQECDTMGMGRGGVDKAVTFLL